jgi:osmotically-inducible protein OsmY
MAKRVSWPMVSVALAFVVVAGAGAGARADQGSVAERVEARLLRAGLGRDGSTAVALEGAQVVLSGSVGTLGESRAAEKLARKETLEVDNRLRVAGPDRPDDEVRRAVERAILGCVNYGVFDSVAMGVADGTVYLRGSVLQPYRKEDLEDRVARVPGVRRLESEIRVQPVSLFDDALRRQLYRAIYGDSLFSHLAGRPDPPVRIVVENGRVTLTGYVSSRVQQAALGHIARGVLAFAVDNKVEVEG